MNIRPIDMRLMEDLFEMGSGYVLDFSNRTFSDFFLHEVGVDIYDEAYAVEGTSKAKRLRALLQIGQKAAVIKALNALWEYRQISRRRAGTEEEIPDARDELSAIIERMGGKPLKEVRKTSNARSIALDQKRVAQLAQALSDINNLEPHPRGFAFERFLKDLFDVYGLEARRAFRNTGEQIDGSFQLENETYLLEAKWQGPQVGAESLHAFHGKVLDKVSWARGLFISYSGFTEEGLSAFRGKKIILMDGLDLYDTLRRNLSVSHVISLKVRYAVETGLVFARVRDLIPE